MFSFFIPAEKQTHQKSPAASGSETKKRPHHTPPPAADTLGSHPPPKKRKIGRNDGSGEVSLFIEVYELFHHKVDDVTLGQAACSRHTGLTPTTEEKEDRQE